MKDIEKSTMVRKSMLYWETTSVVLFFPSCVAYIYTYTRQEGKTQKRKSSLKAFCALSRLYFTQKAMDEYFEQYNVLEHKRWSQTDQILALPITS